MRRTEPARTVNRYHYRNAKSCPIVRGVDAAYAGGRKPVSLIIKRKAL